MPSPAEPLADKTAVIPGRPIELEKAAADDQLPIGAIVGGYVIDDVRLEGGFAVVYRARPRAGGEQVAVKVLRREMSLLPAVLRRFEQEAELLARLRHPAIVEVRDTGALDDGRPFFVMEWVEGRSLAAELRARGALSPGEALALLEEIGGALSASHALGIVHRDVKAQNVIVGSRPGQGAKLVDFGIAKLLDPRSGAHGGMTSSVLLGTPLTMAPEQILGGVVDARTDVYALGLLAYQLVTAELPFRGADEVETEEMHLHAPPPRASERAPVSAAYDAVVRRCLAKEPSDRYPSVPALLAALREAVVAPREAPLAAGATRAAPLAAGATRAALLVEARLAAPDEAGDDALDDVERLVAQARTALDRIGATVVVESADAVLATLPDSYQRTPERALGWALDLWADLGARASACSEVSPRLTLHADAPEALRSWAPAPTGEGVFVTAAFAAGLERALPSEPSGALRRMAP